MKGNTFIGEWLAEQRTARIKAQEILGRERLTRSWGHVPTAEKFGQRAAHECYISRDTYRRVDDEGRGEHEDGHRKRVRDDGGEIERCMSEKSAALVGRHREEEDGSVRTIQERLRTSTEREVEEETKSHEDQDESGTFLNRREGKGKAELESCCCCCC